MLLLQGSELAVVEISKATSVISDDVIDTMTRLGMLKFKDGDHKIIATPVRWITLLRVGDKDDMNKRRPSK